MPESSAAEGFRLIACLPTYKEGRLVQSALRSIVYAVDAVMVWEGSAGKVSLPDGCPETDLGDLLFGPDDDYREGVWASDPAKRTEMLKHVRERFHDRPAWILWLDADEIMVNADYLRDLVRRQMWEDEQRGASIVKPDNLPTGGLILRYVEADGSVSKEWGRLVRADLIRRYEVSNLVVEGINGVRNRLGRRIEDAREWRDPRERVHGHALVLDPPLPGEPHFVHRSHLRHPLRERLRLHEQEHDKLVELGLPTGAET